MPETLFAPPVPLSARHLREDFICSKGAMDAFLNDWELERGDAERLWVVTPADVPYEVAAYYAVDPDPLEIAAGEVEAPDGIIHLTGLAVARKYERQGLGTRLLLRLFRQIADLNPSSAEVLVGEALDNEALTFYLTRDLGFERLAPKPSRRVGVPAATIRDLMSAR